MKDVGISPESIRETIRFHGHHCPGLALGIRVAEVVLRENRRAPDEELVAVVETDMCGVDAIQYLTGCTFGKGNLLHLDYGKNVFTFYRRSDGKGIRIAARPEVFDGDNGEMIALIQKKVGGEKLTADEEKKLDEMRENRIKRIMEADLDELFSIRPAEGEVPRRARIMESLVCESCKEKTMETRTRRFQGKTVCIPCFEKEERRIPV
ncbi:MAG: TraR/DksA C4-type zinc finger protein [Deltaproteobacteria bacterium]|nr:TraR/DksA C4-type zinc finger protein [Deltaproteobacteria bacterium]MBW2017800.1 TraR/DksA C4-type zinc finger protein [Deltaproteobacteria bacterium]MBW2128032.1 TraR/DksA C4-type zinc finger protein [Deltaproteobacteria bacterium]MBW2305041.1 TraR/DksA C4-type zinc finger protein [Deltaproteobacteria bacterium]